MLTLDFKAAWSVTEGGEVEGLASVFGTADRGGDVVHKGAFASATFPLPMLDAHDPSAPIGVWESGEETPEGLRVKGRLILSVERAREVRDLILSKSIAGLSIGYRALKKAARVGGGRDLFAVELVEISVTAVPMHPGARIISAKGAQMEGGRMDGDDDKGGAGETEKKAVGNDQVAAMGALVAAAMKPVMDRLDKVEAKAARVPAAAVSGELTVERKAFRSYLQRGADAVAEVKELRISEDARGGYLAPPEFSSEILRDITEMNELRKVASVRGTRSESVIYGTRKDFEDVDPWKIEGEGAGELDGNLFGSKEVKTFTMRCDVVVSNQALADAVGLEAEVRAAAADFFARQEAKAFALGDGGDRPDGLLKCAEIPVYKNGHAENLVTDALVKLPYDLPGVYRRKGAWAMNRRTMGELRTLKDANGRFMWQDGLTLGQPAMFLGYTVIEVPDMDDVAAGAVPILFGDFSGYRILDREGLSTLVNPFLMAAKDKTVIHLKRRVGGRVLEPKMFRKFKMAA